MFGKSKIKFDILDKHYDSNEIIHSEKIQDDYGIIPRGINQVFNRIGSDKEAGKSTEYTVYLSFMQIYNEKIYD
jgi:hypothetical protein